MSSSRSVPTMFEEQTATRTGNPSSVGIARTTTSDKDNKGQGSGGKDAKTSRLSVFPRRRGGGHGIRAGGYRIEEDPATIEAARLREEVAGLREEREKQSKIRIEASLAAKSETRVESLQDELKRLREAKADGDAKLETSVLRLKGRVAELEISAKDLAGQKKKATVNATKEALGGLRVHRQDERDAAVGGETTSSRSRRRGEGAEQNRGCGPDLGTSVHLCRQEGLCPQEGAKKELRKERGFSSREMSR
ncbi:hypothetical protein THAOC_18756 [Thalassiosira oceanica]|uniref:Uncharacterized protein n=1 Tax=Thalassiosira oceanica TaxID=159749 RepID=K0SR80_THAOC|nr:hypothetical protein THAOC_18756 [Thalassiosira oceanica]|eukprot:EJK60832.1 hypothetical protein THAOC_18756 [Thalassiosira oceanica]